MLWLRPIIKVLQRKLFSEFVNMDGRSRGCFGGWSREVQKGQSAHSIKALIFIVAPGGMSGTYPLLICTREAKGSIRGYYFAQKLHNAAGELFGTGSFIMVCKFQDVCSFQVVINIMAVLVVCYP